MPRDHHTPQPHSSTLHIYSHSHFIPPARNDCLHCTLGSRRHVFVVEWGADGESPPSHRVNRLVAALNASLPQDSMITVVGPSAPQVDCRQAWGAGD